MKKTTAQMIKELRSALSDPKLSKTEFVRVQAVLFRKKKLSRHETAEMVNKSIHAIEDWVTTYNQRGTSGLKSFYPAHSGRAKIGQKKRLKIKEILMGNPQEAEVADEEYWRLDLVKKLVYKVVKVKYKSDSSYRSLLSEAGLSYQKASFEDKKKDQSRHDGFKKRFEGKIKKGNISMWW